MKVRRRLRATLRRTIDVRAGDRRLVRAEDVAARIALAWARAELGSVHADGTSVWFNGPEWDSSWAGALRRQWRRDVPGGLTLLDEGTVEVLPLSTGWRLRTRLTFDDFYQIYVSALMVMLAGAVMFAEMPLRLVPGAFVWLCLPIVLSYLIAWWSIPRCIANAVALD